MFIKGHAEYDVKGKDIVCAGVSALTMAFIKALRDIDCGDYSLYTLIDDGEVFIVAKNFRNRKTYHKVKNFTEMLVTGITEIQSLHPGNVRIRRI